MKARRSFVRWAVFAALLVLAACLRDMVASARRGEEREAASAPRAGDKPMAPPALRAAYVASVQRDAEASYRVGREGEVLRAHNAAEKLEVSFARAGVTLEPGSGEAFAIGATQWGCEGAMAPLGAAEPEERGNRVEYRRGEVTEWYVNGPLGVEQGFRLEAPPACARQGGEGVVIALGGARGGEASAAGNGAVLRDGSGKARLRARELYVSDASGRQLAGELKSGPEGLSIRVEDQGARYPIVIDPLWVQQQQLTTTDGDYFGFSVAVSGETAVVGEDAQASNTGAAYVFVYSGGAWIQQQKLTATDGAAGDYFGGSVAVSGETAIVGADGHESNTGAAYVFVRSGGAWIQQQKLTAADGAAGDYFGGSVAVSGETAVVGAYRKASKTGAAYVFVRSGGAWLQQQKLTATDGKADDEFGASVAVSGETAVVGAWGQSSKKGAAYVFVRSGGAWSPQQMLNPTDGMGGDEFGVSVAVSGETVVVGADGQASGKGAAYVFVRSGGAWSQQQELTATDGAKDNGFGASVAVSGETAVVGAPGQASYKGAAYVFVRSGGAWSQQQELTDTDCAKNSFFGISVAVSGGTAVVGTPGEAFGNGAAYVFGPGRPGGACANAAECASGYCVDGVCCDTACPGTGSNACSACTKAKGALADGTCTPLTGLPCDDGNACTPHDVCVDGVCIGLNPKTCVPQYTCQGVGVCNPKTATCDFNSPCPVGAESPPSSPAEHLGDLCTTQQDCDNLKATCVAEGRIKVCCDKPCEDLCSSCLVPGHIGTCTVEPKGMDLRGECFPGTNCLYTCSGPADGGDPSCIDADAETQCSVRRCVDRTHVAAAALCPALGAPCTEDPPIDCSPYACDPSQIQCRTECRATDDCAPGFVCTPPDASHPRPHCAPPPSSSALDDALCACRESPPATSDPALPRASLLAWLALAALAPLRRAVRGRRAATTL